ncbi:hypothetical protein RHGRI_018028 [Rhododendron griersonianum]|uniref:Uncharacterized protein n=1 Tax=Rhododendron griersonianum TaxID=479676 RepID=A0AAV6JZY2_9ERIC|nr:hypothetical protein RHGRI_018028 [Rhododendron griersonianum]
MMTSASQQHVIAPSAPHGALSSATSPAQSPATSSIQTHLRCHCSSSVSHSVEWYSGIYLSIWRFWSKRKSAIQCYLLFKQPVGRDGEGGYFLYYADETFNNHMKIELASSADYKFLVNKTQFVGSCNGLLCFSGLENSYLWNPAVNRCIVIPNSGVSSSEHSVFGFGSVPRIDDYKLVRVWCNLKELAGQDYGARVPMLQVEMEITPPKFCDKGDNGLWHSFLGVFKESLSLFSSCHKRPPYDCFRWEIWVMNVDKRMVKHRQKTLTEKSFSSLFYLTNQKKPNRISQILLRNRNENSNKEEELRKAPKDAAQLYRSFQEKKKRGKG